MSLNAAPTINPVIFVKVLGDTSYESLGDTGAAAVTDIEGLAKALIASPSHEHHRVSRLHPRDLRIFFVGAAQPTARMERIKVAVGGKEDMVGPDAPLMASALLRDVIPFGSRTAFFVIAIPFSGERMQFTGGPAYFRTSTSTILWTLFTFCLLQAAHHLVSPRITYLVAFAVSWVGLSLLTYVDSHARDEVRIRRVIYLSLLYACMGGLYWRGVATHTSAHEL